MCGYCTEHAYFDWLTKVKKVSSPKLIANIEGQLTNEFLVNIIAQEEGNINQNSKANIIVPKIYEFFITNGFNQKLIDQILVNQALKKSIYKDWEQSGVLLNHYPEIPKLLKQLDPEIIINKNWNTFISNKEASITANVELLIHYHHWWLQGNNKSKSDSSERLNNTGMLDPIMDTPSIEWQKFNIIFPLVYFSLIYLQKEQPNHLIIKKIAFTNAEVCPFFDALDLWLQRKAFIHYIQHQGIQNTLDNIVKKGNRIELLWYAVMKLKLSQSDVQLIINVLNNHPELYGSSSAGSYYYIEKIESYLHQ